MPPAGKSPRGYASVSVTSELNSRDSRYDDSEIHHDDVEAAFVAELFGTLVYVQMGCAANCVAAYTQAELSSWWTVSLVWAVALTLGIFISIPASGAHLNPAVSLSFALVRPDDFDFQTKLLPYVIAQLIGAMIAGAINLFLFHEAIINFEIDNHIVRGGDDEIRSAVGFGDYFSLNPRLVKSGFQAFFIEAFGTCLLVLVMFALTSKRNGISGTVIPPSIGATLGVLVAVFGPMTGGSFNPARDLGPRAMTVVGRWRYAAMQDWLPYVAGPLVGGPIGAFLADNVLYMNEYLG